jgi:hypothetical protein
MRRHAPVSNVTASIKSAYLATPEATASPVVDFQVSSVMALTIYRPPSIHFTKSPTLTYNLQINIIYVVFAICKNDDGSFA